MYTLKRAVSPRRQVDSTGEVLLLDGFLTKLGKNVKSWKRRFFAVYLDGQRLPYMTYRESRPRYARGLCLFVVCCLTNPTTTVL